MLIQILFTSITQKFFLKSGLKLILCLLKNPIFAPYINKNAYISIQWSVLPNWITYSESACWEVLKHMSRFEKQSKARNTLAEQYSLKPVGDTGALGESV